MPINRDSMFVVANELRKNFWASFIVEQLYEQARKNDKNTIIESIRAVGEVETLKWKENFIFFAIDADQKTRYQRIVLRSWEKDKVSYDEFLLNEQREMTNTDPSKQNLSACMEMADYTFTNNGTLEDLYQQIEIVINEFRI